MRKRDDALHARRRAQIIAAASDCFVRKGFHQASMQEICDAAGMSPGALYRYFESKEAIIEALADKERAETAELIAHVKAAGSLAEGLSAASGEIMAALTDPGYARLAIEVAAEATRNPQVAKIYARSEVELRAALAESLRRGQEAGDVDTDLDCDAAIALILALFDGIAGRAAFSQEIPPRRLARSLSRLIHRMLAPNRRNFSAPLAKK